LVSLKSVFHSCRIYLFDVGLWTEPGQDIMERWEMIVGRCTKIGQISSPGRMQSGNDSLPVGGGGR